MVRRFQGGIGWSATRLNRNLRIRPSRPAGGRTESRPGLTSVGVGQMGRTAQPTRGGATGATVRRTRHA
jgi:hypothetical protein